MNILQTILETLQYNVKDPLLFNSMFFLFFFFLFLAVYQFVQHKINTRIIIVSVFSLFFFYKACGWYVGCIIAAAVIDFYLSNKIFASKHKRNKKLLLITSIILNLGLLCFFKYTNLFITTINDLSHGHIRPLQLILPIGISFYTFENLSYTIDVYRGKFEPVKRFWDYLFFLSFFPKLMMGPIVRAADFIPQIRKSTQVSNLQVSSGLYLIMIGIIKKMVISDFIYANYVERIFDNPSMYTGMECLLAVYGYAMVIYCDFSGYSNMTMGMAKWMGFEINSNFDAPYQSKSITEFWRRWHISLSSWLKDYLYIPLGGNQLGKKRQYINLFITMLLGGLWHGASWNFVLWGGLHGSALGIDKFKNEMVDNNVYIKKKLTQHKKLINFLGVFITFHFVCFCWIFFKASSFNDSCTMVNKIANHFNGQNIAALITAYSLVILLTVLGFVFHFMPSSYESSTVNWLNKKPISIKIGMLVLVILIAVQFKQAAAILPVYLQF